MDVGSAENARSNFLPTHMDVGSAENARSNFLPTHMDVGSAENAWSNFLPTHHGKDYSYNPVAFPPSMEVRCGKCRQKQGSALTMTAKAGEEMRHTKPSKQTMLF
jgi:hypothetical protein